MRLAAGGNGNNRCDWVGNVNTTWLNMGAALRIGMNSWEREGWG